MNRAKKSIRVLATTAVVFVDIGQNVALRRAPETLEEAQNLWCLGVAICATLAKLSSQRTALNESTELGADGEETGSVDFFPKVKASLIPWKWLAVASVSLVVQLTNTESRSSSHSG